MPDTDGGGPRPTAAVLLAAGEGKRMRSALPKVMHPIGGVTLLGHAVAAVAALAPEHLAVVVGHGREQVSSEVEALGEQLGRPARHRGAGAAARHRARGALRARGVAVRARGRRGRHLRRRAAAGRRHAADAAGRTRCGGGGRHAAHRRVRRSRPGTAGCCAGRTARSPASSSTPTPTPEQRAIREINSGVYAFDAAFLTAGLGGALGPQRTGRALPDRPRGRRRRPGPAGARRGVPGPVAGPGRERPGAARAGARRAEPAGAGALDARRGDRGRPRDDLGGRRGAAGPGRRALPGHPAARIARSSTTARRSGRTPR